MSMVVFIRDTASSDETVRDQPAEPRDPRPALRHAAWMIRILKPGDEAALETFLGAHASTSLFLRANLAEAGIVDAGKRFQGTYAAAFENDRIVAVACHCWNGILLLQAPRRLDEVAAAAIASSGREIKGFLGTWDQVAAARETTGHRESPTRMESPEDLFELRLTDLRLPESVRDGRIVVRRIVAEDLPDFVRMQVAYEIEAIHATPGPWLEESERAEAERSMAAGTSFIALQDGRGVAAANFNARIDDCVQLGGVYTPPELRGRGHARAVVGGALAIARAEGVPLAVLFTGKDNEPARRAYLSLGFRIIGDYGIVLLA